MIFRRKRPASTRARQRVQVGRELFARDLRKLARFYGHSSPRPPMGEKNPRDWLSLCFLTIPCSDLRFGGVGNPFLPLLCGRGREPPKVAPTI